MDQTAHRPFASVLALDLGRHTGWIFRRSDLIVATGTLAFENPETGAVLAALSDRLADLVTDHEPVLIAYEAPVKHYQGWFLKTSMAGICELIAYRRELFVASVTGSTIKKHATGAGNADKPAVVAAAIARGWAPANDHEADAMWLADYVMTGGERERAA